MEIAGLCFDTAAQEYDERDDRWSPVRDLIGERVRRASSRRLVAAESI